MKRALLVVTASLLVFAAVYPVASQDAVKKGRKILHCVSRDFSSWN